MQINMPIKKIRSKFNLFFISLAILLVTFTAQFSSYATPDYSAPLAMKLSSSIIQNLKEAEGKVLALEMISPLDKKDAELGKAVMTKFVDAMVQSGSLKIIDHQELHKVLKLQGMEQSGIVEDASLRKVGKILSADYLFSGYISSKGNRVFLSARVTKTDTGEIVFASTLVYPDTADSRSNELSEKDLVSTSEQNGAAYRRNLDTVQYLNQLYRVRPLVFLIATLDRKDIARIEKEHPNFRRRLRALQRRLRREDHDIRKRINVYAHICAGCAGMIHL